MTEFVHGDQYHEDQSELPAPKQCVKPDRRQKRTGEPKQFEADRKPFQVQQNEENRLELRQQSGDCKADCTKSLGAILRLMLRGLRRLVLAFDGVVLLVVVPLRPACRVLIHLLVVFVAAAKQPLSSKAW